MKSVDFIRHGLPVYDRKEGNIYSADAPLSIEGIQQVVALADEYKRRNVQFKRIYTSPLPRAYQTALMLPLKPGGKIIKLPELAEPDWGPLVGMPFASFPKQANGRGVDLYAKDMGQEPFPKTVERVRRGLAFIKRRLRRGESIAVVSHGVISKIGIQFFMFPNAPIPNAESDLPETDQLDNAQASHIVVTNKNAFVAEERIGGSRR